MVTSSKQRCCAIGDGTHMVPLKAALRKRINKEVGDAVAITLCRRDTEAATLDTLLG